MSKFETTLDWREAETAMSAIVSLNTIREKVNETGETLNAEDISNAYWFIAGAMHVFYEMNGEDKIKELVEKLCKCMRGESDETV